MLNLVGGFIQTDIYSKPTDNYIYLLHNSAHTAHCMKAIPFGVATRARRNCPTPEAVEKCSKEYQEYLINRGYNPRQVQQQFNKVTSAPRETCSLPRLEREKFYFLWSLISIHTNTQY